MNDELLSFFLLLHCLGHSYDNKDILDIFETICSVNALNLKMPKLCKSGNIQLMKKMQTHRLKKCKHTDLKNAIIQIKKIP